MKVCPKCQKTYEDAGLQFCLEDGELLTQSSYQPPPNRWDEPKTVVQDKTTNPFNRTDWASNPGPVQNWQNQAVNQQFQQFAPRMEGQNQTMAIASLVLSCLSICCYIGWITGPIGLLLGYLHRKNVKENPNVYGGDGLALAGMIVGGVMGALWIVFIIFYIILFGVAALLG
jgi:hypothetical protein